MKPGQRLALDLAFKGERTYLHGTDILNALEKNIGPLQRVSFRMHKVATHGLCAIGLPFEGVTTRDLAGVLLFGAEEPRSQIGLEENEDQPIEGRYAYDEAAVVAAATFEKGGAVMSRNPEFSFIEQLVALNKALLQKEIEQQNVKWYFTQLDVAFLPKDFTKLRLTVVQRLGIRLVKSKIEIDGASFGSIAFSGVTL
ncbi:MAG: hypothetical protein A2516_08600 [Alphaproteobacteria bacterium RIFOXYD12_FULL_60_8]|nr:MAG: hypothetical protein A2516_08600 [Alphaproteobacteria bacterium RIFOXYD12_FULL_60_8]